MSAWRDPRLVVGIALVALCALLGATLWGSGDTTAGVWAARTALPDGQGLSAEDLVRREVGFADQADADHYLSADVSPPEGRILSRAVGAGELLARTALEAGEAEASLEVPLPVPTDSLPSTVTAGSIVDVWVTPDPGLTARSGESESFLVLDDVRVVELSRASGGLGTGTRQVVVALDAGQEDTLPSALARIAQGAVVLVRTP